jgi:hypothetical protein
MNETAPKTKCRRCGVERRLTSRGGMTSHECPHGFVCVAAPRKRNRKREACPFCFESKQERLFP